MPAIRPVLLVGSGDVADLRAMLQAHGVGTMVASTAEQARTMLRHFRVDAIVGLTRDVEELRALSECTTPLVVIGADPHRTRDVNCAAFVSDVLHLSALPRILARVMKGERGIEETRGAA